MLNKKLIVLLLITLFLANGPIQAEADADKETQKIEAKQIDKRAEVVQAYLAKYNSPMQYQAQDFVDAADAYNMDWKLLVAIAGVESTFGKFIPGGYNAWGWGVYGNQALYFKSWKEGVFTVSAGLRQNYMDKGLTNPYSINRIYSESPRWGSNVTYFLNEIDRFQEEYEKYSLNDTPANLASKTAGTSANLALNH